MNLVDAIVDIYHCIFVKTHSVNRNVNYIL